MISPLVELALRTGVSAYVEEGENCWSAVHLDDAARLYVLALEKNSANSRYHAVAEPAISMRTVAQTLGRVLKLPVKQRGQPDSRPLKDAGVT